MKKLHRAIMLSAVYQLGDEADGRANVEKDAGNRLYWRANRRRMTAEQIRDSTLAVSGALDLKMGGPSEELTPDFNRRTIYGKVSRYKLDQYLQLFDFPAATISAEQRFTTSVPLQRLFFMNSDFMQQQGELLARRVAANEPDMRARDPEGLSPHLRPACRREAELAGRRRLSGAGAACVRTRNERPRPPRRRRDGQADGAERRGRRADRPPTRTSRRAGR